MSYSPSTLSLVRAWSPSWVNRVFIIAIATVLGSLIVHAEESTPAADKASLVFPRGRDAARQYRGDMARSEHVAGRGVIEESGGTIGWLIWQDDDGKTLAEITELRGQRLVGGRSTVPEVQWSKVVGRQFIIHAEPASGVAVQPVGDVDEITETAADLLQSMLPLVIHGMPGDFDPGTKDSFSSPYVVPSSSFTSKPVPNTWKVLSVDASGDRRICTLSAARRHSARDPSGNHDFLEASTRRTIDVDMSNAKAVLAGTESRTFTTRQAVQGNRVLLRVVNRQLSVVQVPLQK